MYTLNEGTQMCCGLSPLAGRLSRILSTPDCKDDLCKVVGSSGGRRKFFVFVVLGAEWP